MTTPTPASPTATPPPIKDTAPGNESVIWIVATCRFAEAVAMGMLIPILPLFLVHLGHASDGEARSSTGSWLASWLGNAQLTAEEQTAILFSFTGFAMAFIQIVSGRLSDALDARKPIIVAGMVGGALCSATYPALENYGGLLGVRVLQGICMGLTFPPMMAIIARHSPEGRGGRSLGIYSTIRLLGFAGGPLVGAWVTSYWGYDGAFTTSAGLLALSIVLVSVCVPEVKDGPRARREDGSKEPLPPVPFNLRLLGGATFLMMVGISAMISLFPTYQREYGATEQELGLLFSAFIFTRFLLQYPLGILGDRYDKKWVLVIAMALLVPSVALQGFIRSLDDLLVLRIMLGVAAAAMSVSVNGIAAERATAGNRARVMGINTFSFSLGVAFGPLLGGFFADARIAFGIPAVVTCLVAATVLIWVPSDRQFRRAAQSAAAS